MSVSSVGTSSFAPVEVQPSASPPPPSVNKTGDEAPQPQANAARASARGGVDIKV